MNRERYRHGSHTVTELKYHFVWKTKYSYPVLRGEIGLRLRQMLREVCVARDDDYRRQYSSQSCSPVGQCADPSLPGKDGAISEGAKRLSVTA